MANYRLLVDSSCSIPEEIDKNYDYGMTNLIIHLDNKEYIDRKEISVEDFVSWCFDRNAGHWPNGTPMCDD